MLLVTHGAALAGRKGAMQLRRVLLVVGVGLAAAVTAVVVYAQLDDSQTAAGTINATTRSADLYICEPDSTPGPACGSDDSGADEAVPCGMTIDGIAG